MGLLSKANEDLTVTRKMADGTTLTVKSPNGSSMDMMGLLGGMVEGRSPTPVADNVPANLTAGEFVINQPAAQKYKGLLEQINQEGRMALQAGGWVDKAKPMGYAGGGDVGGTIAQMWLQINQLPADQQNAAIDALPVDVQNQLFNYDENLSDTQRQLLINQGQAAVTASDAPGAGFIQGQVDAGSRELSQAGIPTNQQGFGVDVNVGGPQGGKLPPTVVLDPNSTDKAEFDRMNTLVSQGAYTIQQDRAGRAIYQLTDLGSSKNTRAFGSGTFNPGVDTSNLQGRQGVTEAGGANQYMRMPIAELQALAEGGNKLAQQAYAARQGGRGKVVEQYGAREDVIKFGQPTQAPTHQPGGGRIQYKSGQIYNVADKAQAEQFVAAGIVAVGARFVTADGIKGVAQ